MENAGALIVGTLCTVSFALVFLWAVYDFGLEAGAKRERALHEAAKTGKPHP